MNLIQDLQSDMEIPDQVRNDVVNVLNDMVNVLNDVVNVLKTW